MKIGFDISQTGASKTGCGYFAEGLIRALEGLGGADSLILYPAFGDVFWDPLCATAAYSTSNPRFTRRKVPAKCSRLGPSGAGDSKVAFGTFQGIALGRRVDLRISFYQMLARPSAAGRFEQPAARDKARCWATAGFRRARPVFTTRPSSSQNDANPPDTPAESQVLLPREYRLISDI